MPLFFIILLGSTIAADRFNHLKPAKVTTTQAIEALRADEAFKGCVKDTTDIDGCSSAVYED